MAYIFERLPVSRPCPVENAGQKKRLCVQAYHTYANIRNPLLGLPTSWGVSLPAISRSRAAPIPPCHPVPSAGSRLGP